MLHQTLTSIASTLKMPAGLLKPNHKNQITKTTFQETNNKNQRLRTGFEICDFDFVFCSLQRYDLVTPGQAFFVMCDQYNNFPCCGQLLQMM